MYVRCRTSSCLVSISRELARPRISIFQRSRVNIQHTRTRSELFMMPFEEVNCKLSSGAREHPRRESIFLGAKAESSQRDSPWKRKQFQGTFGSKVSSVPGSALREA